MLGELFYKHCRALGFVLRQISGYFLPVGNELGILLGISRPFWTERSLIAKLESIQDPRVERTLCAGKEQTVKAASAGGTFFSLCTKLRFHRSLGHVVALNTATWTHKHKENKRWLSEPSIVNAKFVSSSLKTCFLLEITSNFVCTYNQEVLHRLNKSFQIPKIVMFCKAKSLTQASMEIVTRCCNFA